MEGLARAHFAEIDGDDDVEVAERREARRGRPRDRPGWYNHVL